MADPEDEYQEITLADIVRTIYRRKFLLGGILFLAILGGVAVTVFADTHYEASATLVPLEHEDIIQNWLASRNASALAAEAVGDPLLQELFPDRWDDETQQWRDGQRPTSQQAGAALKGRSSVSSSATDRGTDGDATRLIRVKVSLDDPILARDAANALVDTLEDLRPTLESITRQEAFDRYYTGTNEQEAQERASVTARQKDYWLRLDDAAGAGAVGPNATLNLALSVVLGLMLGVFAVFFAEWVSNFRAEARQVEEPPEPEERAPDQSEEGRPRRYF